MPKWTIGRLTLFDPKQGQIQLDGQELAPTPPIPAIDDRARAILRRAARHKDIIALQWSANSFEFGFPHIGVPTLRPLTQTPERYSVLLKGSCAALQIDSTHPSFAAIKAASSAATAVALMLEPQGFNIADCHTPVTDTFTCLGTDPKPAGPLPAEAASMQEAEEMFKFLETISCRKHAPLCSPCFIPFAFPDAGCDERAHKACQMLLCENPGWEKYLFKVRIDTPGNTVPTQNSPKGFVQWEYHVAPALHIQDRASGGKEVMVLDPALFAAPVSKDRWISRVCISYSQASSCTEIPSWAYKQSGKDWTSDVDLFCTDNYLRYHRQQLETRVSKRGWPPYY